MKKKIFILAAIVLAAAVLGVGIYLLLDQMAVNKAFSSKNSGYHYAQITISQKGKDYTPTTDTTEDDQQDGVDHYNEDVSLEGSGESYYDMETQTTLEKAGDVYCETLGQSKTYYYTRDGQRYLCYYAQELGKDGGTWTERSLEDTYAEMGFDFACLDQIDLKKLDRDGSSFTAQAEYRDALLQLLLGFDSSLQKDYRADDIRFRLEGSQIASIRIEFAYKANLYMYYEYTFAYEKQEIALPQVGSEEP